MIHRSVMILLVLISSVIWVSASEVAFIGILVKKEINSLNFSSDSGRYEVWTNGAKSFEVDQSKGIKITADKGQVIIMGNDTLMSRNFVLRFYGKNNYSTFHLSSPQLDTNLHHYEGDLLITANRSELKLINIVNIEKYLKRVLKAEIGTLEEPEFLKAMAVVSRTYTLKNMYRHADEGFDLCDQTHCQVYKGEKKISDNIGNAIKETEGEVIVDSRHRMINAVFHSNSGGQTVGSETVWASSMPYLKPKTDPYAQYGKQFYWTKNVPVKEWKSYLYKKTGKKADEYYCDTSFTRNRYYYHRGVPVHLNEIRKEFNLRSTYFIMEENGDSLTFYGRGYGHGVGLSQEGANRMAELGRDYKTIVQYYYLNVKIINYSGGKAVLR